MKSKLLPPSQRVQIHTAHVQKSTSNPSKTVTAQIVLRETAAPFTQCGMSS